MTCFNLYSALKCKTVLFEIYQTQVFVATHGERILKSANLQMLKSTENVNSKGSGKNVLFQFLKFTNFL